ncbi:hypothetical protein Hte_009934 [Hypoxylon texense]
MHSLLSPLTFGSMLMLSSPSAAAAYGHLPRDKDPDVITITLPASSSVHGTLTIARDRMAHYYKHEVGIDLDKLHDHPGDESLFFGGDDGGGSKNYTFPEDSGIEGALSWNPTTTTTTNTTNASDVIHVPDQQHLTCEGCWGLCGIPLVGPTM